MNKEGTRKAVGLALLALTSQPRAQQIYAANLTALVNMCVSLLSYFHYSGGTFTAHDFFVRPCTPPRDLRTVQPEYERIKAVRAWGSGKGGGFEVEALLCCCC